MLRRPQLFRCSHLQKNVFFALHEARACSRLPLLFDSGVFHGSLCSKEFLSFESVLHGAAVALMFLLLLLLLLGVIGGEHVQSQLCEAQVFFVAL